MDLDDKLYRTLSLPPYIFTIIASVTMAWVSDKYHIRWPILVVQSLMAIIGLLLILYIGSPGVKYLGLFLATCGAEASIPSSLSYGQSQTASVQKRGIVAAVMISVGGIGAITGTTIFRPGDSPVRSRPPLILPLTPS